MALKFNLDSLEGLDESIAKLYKKKSDGKFQLAVEGLPPPEDTAGLKAAATWKARSHEATYHLSPEQLEILKLARGAASAAMSQVRKSGIQFDRDFKLGIVDVLEKQGWRCALTGIAFNSKKTSLGAGGRDYSPSPDRIKPDKGYVKENVQWFLWASIEQKGVCQMSTLCVYFLHSEAILRLIKMKKNNERPINCAEIHDKDENIPIRQ